ncbi:MAG: hypothetical protein L6R40_001060 [Gallowayella cf. fulva]|nr:MAG: hypothetical protein L6R40_001060 [Xanthomendoza cf. fulva]
MPRTLGLFGVYALFLHLVAVLLLSDQVNARIDRTITETKVLHLVPSDIDRAINIPDSSNRVILPFGRQDHTSPFSSHAKRTLSEPFHCLIEKGQQYYEQGVLPAFDGQSRFPNPFTGGSESGIEDLLEDSGWASNDDNTRLGKHWKDAFGSMAGGVPDDNKDVIRIFLDQSGDFVNDYGKQDATSATYHGLYVPHNGAIIIFLSVSPRNKVERRRVPMEDIPKYIPRLNQLSDLVWLAWDNLVENPEVLRYYAVEGIFNAVAKNLMDEIFQQRRGTTNDIPWSLRLTFDLKSDEGKALFASPNGIAVNWLLIHHASLLGRREPRVTIFNPGGSNRCMIWDLVPQGASGSFGDVEEEIPAVWSGSGG